MGDINAFGKRINVEYDFEAESIIRDMKTIQDKIGENHILSYNGLETVSFTGLNNVSAEDIMWWLFTNRPNAEEYRNDIRGYLMSIASEDTEWTEQRNKGLTGIFYRKIRFNDNIVNAVSDECKAVIEQAEQFIRTVQAAKLERKRSEAEKKAEIMSHIDSWTTEEKAIRDEGGKTTEYIHHITVGNNEMTFTERNIFDFGRAVNYKNGLVLSKNGMYFIKTPNGEEPLSQAETEAAIAIFKYGKYAQSGIRM